jgi:hypothetical protein
VVHEDDGAGIEQLHLSPVPGAFIRSFFSWG